MRRLRELDSSLARACYVPKLTPLPRSYGSSDFIVQRTKDIDATALWLARYTARLQGLVRAGLAAPHCFDCNVS